MIKMQHIFTALFFSTCLTTTHGAAQTIPPSAEKLPQTSISQVDVTPHPHQTAEKYALSWSCIGKTFLTQAHIVALLAAIVAGITSEKDKKMESIGRAVALNILISLFYYVSDLSCYGVDWLLGNEPAVAAQAKGTAGKLSINYRSVGMKFFAHAVMTLVATAVVFPLNKGNWEHLTDGEMTEVDEGYYTIYEALLPVCGWLVLTYCDALIGYAVDYFGAPVEKAKTEVAPTTPEVKGAESKIPVNIIKAAVTALVQALLAWGMVKLHVSYFELAQDYKHMQHRVYIPYIGFLVSGWLYRSIYFLMDRYAGCSLYVKQEAVPVAKSHDAAQAMLPSATKLPQTPISQVDVTPEAPNQTAEKYVLSWSCIGKAFLAKFDILLVIAAVWARIQDDNDTMQAFTFFLGIDTLICLFFLLYDLSCYGVDWLFGNESAEAAQAKGIGKPSMNIFSAGVKLIVHALLLAMNVVMSFSFRCFIEGENPLEEIKEAAKDTSKHEEIMEMLTLCVFIWGIALVFFYLYDLIVYVEDYFWGTEAAPTSQAKGTASKPSLNYIKVGVRALLQALLAVGIVEGLLFFEILKKFNNLDKPRFFGYFIACVTLVCCWLDRGIYFLLKRYTGNAVYVKQEVVPAAIKPHEEAPSSETMKRA